MCELTFDFHDFKFHFMIASVPESYIIFSAHQWFFFQVKSYWQYDDKPIHDKSRYYQYTGFKNPIRLQSQTYAHCFIFKSFSIMKYKLVPFKASYSHVDSFFPKQCSCLIMCILGTMLDKKNRQSLLLISNKTECWTCSMFCFLFLSLDK